MEYLFLLTGIIVGGAVVWIFLKSKFDRQSPVSEADYARAQADMAELRTETAKLQEARSHLETSLAEAKSEIDREREKSEELTKKHSEMIAENRNLKQRLEEQKREVEELNKKLTVEFQNIANSILDEKSKKFTEQNKTHLETILSPFKEKIEEFKKKVEDTYDKESRETISLREEVRKLTELNTRVSDEANNLTKALKGDTKTQGNWGEFVLEKILEMSGLEKDREYSTQFNTKNVDGDTIRPDVVVNLPDHKHIIIDSKVSLTAYEAFVRSENEEEQERYKKEHVASMKSHIKLLSEKNYQTGELFSTPDFVLMFVPIEPSFSVAIQADQTLYTYAWEKRIVIVSPSTLLATLRTIASFWKQEKQNKNALEIAKQGGALYDKFVGFAEDLTDVGRKMDSAKDSYKNAMSKLIEGRGNLVSGIEKLKTLGAKATKSIEKKLLDRADE